MRKEIKKANTEDAIVYFNGPNYAPDAALSIRLVLVVPYRQGEDWDTLETNTDIEIPWGYKYPPTNVIYNGMVFNRVGYRSDEGLELYTNSTTVTIL